MANARGKTIDMTDLSIEHSMERGFLHRDYIAHCLRWSHAIKYLHKGLIYKTAKILDVGCGKDLPLARAMYSGKMTNREGLYVGVDVNKLELLPMFKNKPFNIELHGQTDLAKWETEHKFDLVTCFEVLEHVEPIHMIEMLNKIRSLMNDDAAFIVSTPCYDRNVGHADNHVNEITYNALGSIFEASGFNTDKRWGTFASQKDYKHLVYRDGLGKAFDKLGEFYDSNVLANVFAPMYPEASRNVCWELTKGFSSNFENLQVHAEKNFIMGSTDRSEWLKALQHHFGITLR